MNEGMVNFSVQLYWWQQALSLTQSGHAHTFAGFLPCTLLKTCQVWLERVLPRPPSSICMWDHPLAHGSALASILPLAGNHMESILRFLFQLFPVNPLSWSLHEALGLTSVTFKHQICLIYATKVIDQDDKRNVIDG